MKTPRHHHYTAPTILLLSNLLYTTTSFSPSLHRILVPKHVTFPSTTSSLRMAKSNERARIEKKLEDLMDHDWRAFRAQLIAREQVEAEDGARSPSGSSSSASLGDEKTQKQGQIGVLFASAISHIFKKDAAPSDEDVDLFAGDSIGTGYDLPDLQDPFITESEVLALAQPKYKFDKNRWAHSLPDVEPGCVLVANEKLGGIFHQTVVLIASHNNSTGSTGFVINRPMPGDLVTVYRETKCKLDLSLRQAFNSAPVSWGGPVEQEYFSILHGYGEVEGATKLAPGVFVGGGRQLMEEVRNENLHVSDALFIKGHAAWSPGQLSREVQKGVWYAAATSREFILRYAGVGAGEDANTNDLWSDILSCMGPEYAEKARRFAGKGDARLMP